MIFLSIIFIKCFLYFFFGVYYILLLLLLLLLQYLLNYDSIIFNYTLFNYFLSSHYACFIFINKKARNLLSNYPMDTCPLFQFTRALIEHISLDLKEPGASVEVLNKFKKSTFFSFLYMIFLIFFCKYSYTIVQSFFKLLII